MAKSLEDEYMDIPRSTAMGTMEVSRYLGCSRATATRIMKKFGRKTPAARCNYFIFREDLDGYLAQGALKYYMNMNSKGTEEEDPKDIFEGGEGK